jgi:hypothetical protein
VPQIDADSRGSIKRESRRVDPLESRRIDIHKSLVSNAMRNPQIIVRLVLSALENR